MKNKQIDAISEDLVEIFDEEYAKRNLITPQNAAEKLNAKGYRKASEVAREIFAEIEEGVKAAVSALQFENNPIHRKAKHETYSSLMRFIKTVEEKYTVTDTNVGCKYTDGGE